MAVYLVPEIHKNNEFSFTASSKYSMLEPMIVQGYRLWLKSTALSSFIAPFTVIAVPTLGKTAKFYPIRFPGKVPDFEALGLQIDETEQGRVVCMSPEAFLAVERSELCIPMPGKNVHSQIAKYREISALHRLGIIPSLSKLVFQRTVDLSVFAEDIEQDYDVDEPVASALAAIFKTTFRGLTLFGFTRKDDKEKRQCQRIQHKLTRKEGRHAFKDLGPALARYNEICGEDDRERMEYLSGRNYRLLVRSISAVERMFDRVGLHLATDTFDWDVIGDFQRQYDLPVTDVCDTPTLQKLWSVMMSRSIVVREIMTEAGVLQVEERDSQHGNERSFITNDSHDAEGSERDILRTKLNSVLADIPDYESAQLWLDNQVKASLDSVSIRTVVLKERMESITKMAETVRLQVEKISETNDKCDAFLNAAGLSIGDVPRQHVKAQENFEDIKKHISSQRRTNLLLTILVVVYFVIRLHRVFDIFSFAK